MIELTLKFNNMHPNYVRSGKWEDKIYYKLDDNALEKFVAQMEKDLNTHNDEIVENAAEKT